MADELAKEIDQLLYEFRKTHCKRFPDYILVGSKKFNSILEVLYQKGPQCVWPGTTVGDGLKLFGVPVIRVYDWIEPDGIKLLIE